MSSLRYCLIFLLLTTACKHKALTNFSTGDAYYTQVAIHYEKSTNNNAKFCSKNYHKGILLPINSRVTLQDMTNQSILMRIESTKENLLIENDYKKTSKNMIQIFNELFAKEKRDLSVFSEVERKSIIAGKVTPHMTKNAVIAALGYPPVNETKDTSSNKWIYWKSKTSKTTVNFNGDKVISIKE